MTNFLLTGVSSGIGRALTIRLIADGDAVWGVARREQLLEDLKKELKNSQRFVYSVVDISKGEAWDRLIKQMGLVKFLPEVVIFNAAISVNDLASGLDTKVTREVFNTNFFGALEGIGRLLKIVKPKTQFIAISSSSALKGSSIEGVGYPSSKAALSIAFESLQQKYKYKYFFKTIYLGPVNSGMGPFKEDSPIVMSENQAVERIIRAVKGKGMIYCFPGVLFFALKVMKFLPSTIYFGLLSKIEECHLIKQEKLKTFT